PHAAPGGRRVGGAARLLARGGPAPAGHPPLAAVYRPGAFGLPAVAGGPAPAGQPRHLLLDLGPDPPARLVPAPGPRFSRQGSEGRRRGQLGSAGGPDGPPARADPPAGLPGAFGRLPRAGLLVGPLAGRQPDGAGSTPRAGAVELRAADAGADR